MARVILLLILSNLLSCAPDIEINYRDYDNFEGCWKQENASTFEIWNIQNEKVYGKVIEVNQGDTLIREYLRIIQKNNKIFYEAKVPDQNEGKPVLFKLISKNNNNFVFENPKHDFPKKIIYTFQDQKTMSATISGNDKQIHFIYKKIE